MNKNRFHIYNIHLFPTDCIRIDTPRPLWTMWRAVASQHILDCAIPAHEKYRFSICSKLTATNTSLAATTLLTLGYTGMVTLHAIHSPRHKHTYRMPHADTLSRHVSVEILQIFFPCIQCVGVCVCVACGPRPPLTSLFTIFPQHTTMATPSQPFCCYYHW